MLQKLHFNSLTQEIYWGGGRLPLEWGQERQIETETDIDREAERQKSREQNEMAQTFSSVLLVLMMWLLALG